jgi:FG-GAP-like repeat
MISIITCLILISLASCNANVSSQQKPFFAPAPAAPIPLACGPGGVVVGDSNNDGKPDLVAACGEERKLTVLLNIGGAQFRASNPISLPDGPGNIVLGDVNGDRNLDLATDSHDSYGVVLLLGDGKGGFALAPNSPVMMKEGQHPHTHGLALGDVNGDRKLDLITVNSTDNDVSIAFGDGRGNFTRAPATFPVGPSPYPFGFGDINNDNYPDIIATATATGPLRAQQLSSSFALTLLLNDGRGGWNASQLPLRTGEPWHAAIGDVNGDRKADVVATHHDQNVLTVMLGDGAGRFTEAPSSPFNFGHSIFQVLLADVNHDGRLDALGAAGEGVRVMLGDGRGNFASTPNPLLQTGRGVWRLALADVNADSKPDIITTNLESKSIGVLLGQ